MVEKSAALSVLNTSVLIPLDQFGVDFLKRIVQERTYPTICFSGESSNSGLPYDFVAFTQCPIANRNELREKLKGIIRAFKNTHLIVFPDDFCCGESDYRDLLKSYDMSNPKAAQAALERIHRQPDMNWCCLASMLQNEATTITDIASCIRQSIVFVK